MRRLLIAFALLLGSAPAQAAPRWETLPPTPAPVTSARSGYAAVNGIRLYYAITGQGPPVVLLHGGIANSDYWGLQVPALSKHHQVILIDSRGHGRSTRDARPFSYSLMADDVVALLDTLHIPRADIVGWSDGANIGFDLAIRHPTRVGKIFAFAGNTSTAGLGGGGESPSANAYFQRSGKEYEKLSPTPKEYRAFVDQINHMWTTEPNWTDAQLRTITSPVLVVDGDRDLAIKREHIEYIAATIPGAGLLILPNTSHFAFLEDPDFFTAAILNFLDDK